MGAFPSPAQDYVEQRIDLNTLLVKHPSATWFVRASGHAMSDANIHDGDLLVVDSALSAREGSIVIVSVDGEFSVRKLQLHPTLRLLPMSPNRPAVEVNEEENLEIFGVVTWIIYAAA
ncbi:translesion error-prone DNA polymerase V autoproteolytic subunit [Paramixta manurensis]|uniref:Translesion error-prone DNA polymerase V autoproteolytic subunit n=1 Tax=Paramixta manurensis TaxID=2740817 RepID=A0A6M8UF24_9GAMM|nr:translesion error-prone DNA polymerase V autoproteolytic subunit [Erwiniaceae bacterium PD-1]